MVASAQRRPRFRRAPEPPAFRLTDADVDIVRQLARYRFLRSTQVATLVRRSLDRTNDRLARLFHAGYLDRPRAQLDYYPTAGSAPMVYGLADRGARLLIERDGIALASVEWSRKNRSAGRPFIEHQLEIIDFSVALETALRRRSDVRIIHADELAAACPNQTLGSLNPFAMRARLVQAGVAQEIGVVPDLVFGLAFADGTRRCFIVEIDRGTMPVTRSNQTQTSFERKMRGYLNAYAAKQHEKKFGWKAFRVLTVTTDEMRKKKMLEALARVRAPQGPGASLFWFLTRPELSAFDLVKQPWQDGAARQVWLI